MSDRTDDSGGTEPPTELEVEHILAVRTGHGANCSSIGSVVDTLFATATVGAAVFAAVMAALKAGEVSIVPTPSAGHAPQGHARPEKEP